ncbi:MAG: DUF1127 domain-containing protein [Pseudomonadota bacterium]
MNIVVLNTATKPAARTRQTGFWARVRTAFHVWGERQDLSQLDAHMLKDIGLTREDAVAEARRPIWDLPTHR